jgi:hypothetical protein
MGFDAGVKRGVLAVLAVLFLAAAVPASAGVNVNVNLGPPPVVVTGPPVVVAEPPEVVYVPELQVSFVPAGDVDLFFYGGYWWSPRGPKWYRANSCDGPWRVVERRYVPPRVVRMPHDYRTVYVKHDRVPYGQWKKHHKEWEKDRRREAKHEWKERKHERKHHEGRDRDDDHGGHGGRGHRD